MANRSYLYAADALPARGARNTLQAIGIAEWEYDVPLSFRCLVSVNPRKCCSMIWDCADEIAIAGDYDEGISRLLRYLDRIEHPRITELRDGTRKFLTAAENKRRYFILECGEIFEMEDAPLAEQTNGLLSEILELGSTSSDPFTGLDIDSFGLGNWSNVLYFAPEAE